MINIHIVLILISVILFALAATTIPWRVNLTALGLAFFAASFLRF